MKLRNTQARAAGFTIIEVMVALIVISVGLLGIAKMQALAISSTGVSRMRSLAAIEAASLASSMHVNRTYWASTSLTQPITVTGTSATTSDAKLTTALGTVPTSGAYCTPANGAPCDAATMAATDLHAWANELNTMLPGSTATITCSTVAPLSCTILIKWTESAVSLNKQAGAPSSTAGFLTPDYTLIVQP